MVITDMTYEDWVRLFSSKVPERLPTVKTCAREADKRHHEIVEILLETIAGMEDEINRLRDRK